MVIDKLCNQKTLSEILQLSEATIEKWRVRRIGIPWIKIGNRAVRYKLSDVSRYIDSHKTKLESDSK
jgi:phage terminase Nu1 subunit (DNA packaging protein)